MSSQDALAAAHASWNAGDLDRSLRLYDESIRLHGYSPQPMDKDAVPGGCPGARLSTAPAAVDRSGDSSGSRRRR